MRYLLMIVVAFLTVACLQGPPGPAGSSSGYAGPDEPLKIIWSNIEDGASGVEARKQLDVLSQVNDSYRIAIKTNKLLDHVASRESMKAYANGVFLPKTFSFLSWIAGDDVIYNFEPDGSQIGKIFKLEIGTDLTAIDGTKLSEPYSISFTPEPHLRLARIEGNESFPADTSPNVELPAQINIPNELVVKASGGMSLRFNERLLLSEMIKITTNNPELRIDSSYYQMLEEGKTMTEWEGVVLTSYYKNPADSTGRNTFRKNTEYVINIPASLSDSLGNKLPHGYVISFKTGTW